MGFLKRLSTRFSSSPQNDPHAYWIIVQCKRCGEIIRARIDLRNDLSAEYSDAGVTYFCRKTLIGEGRCFQRVEVELTFNADHRLLSREIRGGDFVEE